MGARGAQPARSLILCFTALTFRVVAIWHCDWCRREFNAPDGTVSFFHRCVSQEREPALTKIEGLPLDDAGRDDLWHGLLSIVARVHPLIDP